jgi:hypothetical protein
MARRVDSTPFIACAYDRSFEDNNMGILSKLIAFQMQAKALTAKEVVIESNQILQSFEK